MMWQPATSLHDPSCLCTCLDSARICDQYPHHHLRRSRLAAGALAAFAALRAKRREQRRCWTQAQCYHAYVTLLKALQRWQAHAQDAQLQRLKLQRADAQRRRAAAERALDAWRRYAQRRARKWQALALALSHHKRRLLRRVLEGWTAAVAQGERRRAAAGARMGSWYAEFLEARAGRALVQWLAVSKQRQQLRLLEAGLCRRHLQQVRASALGAWAARVRRRRALGTAGAAMAVACVRWRLRLVMQRWVLVVEAMQGLRNNELRERVVRGACLG